MDAAIQDYFKKLRRDVTLSQSTVFGESRTSSKRCGVIGYHFPVPLFRAAGIDTALIGPVSLDESVSDTWLQTFACSQVRNILAQKLCNRLAKCEAMLFSPGCDSLSSLAGIWSLLFRNEPIHLFRYPAVVDSRHAEIHLFHELERLLEFFEQIWKVNPARDSILESLVNFQKIRSLLLSIYGAYQKFPWLCSFSDVQFVISLAHCFDLVWGEAKLSALENLFNQQGDKSPADNFTKPRILVSGSRLEPWLIALIERAGLSILDDDLFWGRRLIEGETLDEKTEPLLAVARDLLAHRPEPFSFQNYNGRLKALTSSFSDSRIDGVILIIYKFCDSHAFDAPKLEEELAKKAIPVFVLEVMAGKPENEEQILNRLMAFAEQIGR